ncbi:MAG: LytTR family DNA-binding domain-containing protein [Brumimicrobium sp.]|nr:LytTR family DNA-binding domain-containing protein [Brumimicrobium sp.]
MAYKTLIIDDESRTRSLLASMIGNMDLELNIHKDANSVESAFNQIKAIKPDILLLDIQMPDGSGFDLLEKLENRDFEVIFVTAHEEYAIRAIKSSALDYILKPVEPGELETALKNAIHSLDQKRDHSAQYETLLNNIQSDKKKIILRTIESLYIFDLTDIVRCQSERNYTKFFLSDGRKIIISKTLKEYEDVLQYPLFLRCHRSHIINLSYLDRYDKSDGGTIVMKNGDEIPISRSIKERFFEILDNM